jgi:multidrug resistance efflux pump
MSVATVRKLAAGIVALAALLPSLTLAQAPSRVASPATTMQLGIAATGVIEKIFVRDGDQVDAGQLLVTIDCRPLQAEIRVRGANLTAAQAAFERARNGPRLDEVAIGEANVGVARARAEEAQAAYDRAQELHEGITISRANLLQARRDARIAAAQLETRDGGSICCMPARAPKIFPRPRPSVMPPPALWKKPRRFSTNVFCARRRREA